jgi:hypothetical protein
MSPAGAMGATNDLSYKDDFFPERSSVVESVQNDFFLLLFSGLCPETHSLFAKREAKTLIRSV